MNIKLKHRGLIEQRYGTYIDIYSHETVNFRATLGVEYDHDDHILVVIDDTVLPIDESNKQNFIDDFQELMNKYRKDDIK